MPELTTFAQSWLSIAYPENFEMGCKFQGAPNMFRLENPANKDWLFIIHRPLIDNSYEDYYADRRVPWENLFRSGAHPLFPGTREAMFSSGSPEGQVGYWQILIPIDGQNAADKSTVDITVMAVRATKEETRAALEEWTTVIDSIKIDPDKALFTDWDGNEPAVFRYAFYPDFGFICFYDSTAEPIEDFDELSFERGLAKEDRSAAFFISDALYVPAAFHFGSAWPDPADPAWTHMVEGLMTIESGQLVFGAGTAPRQADVTLPGGVYKFRACYGPVDMENDSQEVAFYFQPVREKENNEIIVLKRGRA